MGGKAKEKFWDAANQAQVPFHPSAVFCSRTKTELTFDLTFEIFSLYNDCPLLLFKHLFCRSMQSLPMRSSRNLLPPLQPFSTRIARSSSMHLVSIFLSIKPDSFFSCQRRAYLLYLYFCWV